MSDIFISYASVDRARVETLAKTLQQLGWSIWWDRKIPVGKSFDEVIEQAIDAARCVVVVWSESSVKSQWVKAEAEEGKRRSILVPARIQEVRIPLSFRYLQAAHLDDWQPGLPHAEFDRMLASIAELAPVPSHSDRWLVPVGAGPAPASAPVQQFRNSTLLDTEERRLAIAALAGAIRCVADKKRQASNTPKEEVTFAAEQVVQPAGDESNRRTDRELVVAIRSSTSHLWRELEGLAKDHTDFTCPIRQSSFEQARSALDTLAARGHLSYKTEFAFNTDDDEVAVLYISVVGVSTPLRATVADVQSELGPKTQASQYSDPPYSPRA